MGIIHITPTGRIKWAYDGLPGTDIGAYIFDKINNPKSSKVVGIKIISSAGIPKKLTPRYIRIKKEVVATMNAAEQEYELLNMMDIHDLVNM